MLLIIYGHSLACGIGIRYTDATSAAGYEHEGSKSQRGDQVRQGRLKFASTVLQSSASNVPMNLSKLTSSLPRDVFPAFLLFKFVGLVVDSANQADLTDGRVKKWVAQLIQEGFLESGAPSAATPPAAAAATETAPAEAPAVAAPAPASSSAAPATSGAAAGQASFAKPWHAGRAAGFPATFKEVG